MFCYIALMTNGLLDHMLATTEIVITADATWDRATDTGSCTCAEFGYLKSCSHIESAKVMAQVRGSVSSRRVEERRVPKK